MQLPDAYVLLDKTMANKFLIWVLIFFVSLIFGTCIGAIFSEFYSLSYLFGSIAFSPLSLLLRVTGGLFSLVPNWGHPIWSNGFDNIIVIVFTVLSVFSSFRYLKSGRANWAIAFGISFTVLSFWKCKSVFGHDEHINEQNLFLHLTGVPLPLHTVR